MSKEEKTDAERAADKLHKEAEAVSKLKGTDFKQIAIRTLAGPICSMLVKFCYQDEDFAQEIVKTDKRFFDWDKYPGVAPVCAKIKEIYEWTGDGYSVLVPAGAWDIMQEGVLLGHCSAREDDNVYLERIEQETSYIMFLRKNDKMDSPWYTMEVEPGGNVIQLRTYGDDDGKHKYHDRDEAKAALHIWRREIAKRLGQGELSKAQKSREMLLKYWDGLQKNGNIIHGGYLKGALLVDVLQADYKELNGELPEVAVG